VKNNITNGSLNKWQPPFWTTERRRTLASLASGLQKAGGTILPIQETARESQLQQLSESLNYLERNLEILQFKLQEVLNILVSDITDQLAKQSAFTSDTTGTDMI